MKRPSTFASRLIDARERAGISQTDLATRTGMVPAAINHFERGRRKPSLETLVVLARALGVPVDFLADTDSRIVARVEALEERVRALETKTAQLDDRTIGSVVFGGPRR